MPTNDGTNLALQVESGEPLDVRSFHVEERMNALFQIEARVMSPNPDLDFEAIVATQASFHIAGRHTRSWTGTVKSFEQVRSEPGGLSTYRIQIVPAFWLLSQRRNYRMFQKSAEHEIVRKMLDEWRVPYTTRLDTDQYKRREYRVQYGESDFAFVSRMLEDAGISYFFAVEEGLTKLVLSDSPHTGPLRMPIQFVDEQAVETAGDSITKMRVGREIQPARYTIRDVDYRLPAERRILASANRATTAVEDALEQFHYVPGAFLYEATGGDTPTADDRISSRTDMQEADRMAARRLEARRAEARSYAFESNALDITPGMVVPVVGHSRADVSPDQPLLVVGTVLRGTSEGQWTMECTARSTQAPFRPRLTTPKPRTSGIESATVVGPKGEEIHTDEFGRVRVHFHWDRLGAMDEQSSCWIPVNQPWAGTGFGGSNLPRIGQEVIVDFLGGDPDRPVIIGRVYTQLNPVPFKLPENKTQSGWKSNSTTGTGGYNEIMFEDAAGRELVRVQAEKDMNTLVKHDEVRMVQNDRTTTVKHDETVKIGHDRTEEVGNDESISIGHDRTEKVGNDETITIGNDRTTTIRANEDLTVFGDQSRVVKGNEDVAIQKNSTHQVSLNARHTYGLNLTEFIGVNRSVQVGNNDSLAVGKSRTTVIGENDSLTVGKVHAITAGESHVVTIDPSNPASGGGGGGGGPKTSTTFTNGKIVLTTGAGATLTMDGDTITLDAANIYLLAKSFLGGMAPETILIGTASCGLGGGSAATTMNGTTVSITASGTATIAGATCDVNGGLINLNGPGLPAGRLTDPADPVILNGAATVQIGGPKLPYDAVRLPNGDIQVGDAIVIRGDARFQGLVLARLGTIGSTPSGMQMLENVNNSGHTMTITEYKGDNSFCGPTDYQAATPLGQPVYDGLGNPINDANGNQLMGTGTGSDTELQLNPDLTLPNSNDPSNPMPNDAVLFHEMTHGSHEMNGNYDGSPTPGWDTNEERTTIGNGQGLPGYPTEADYGRDRGYPWRRTDHDSTFEPNN